MEVKTCLIRLVISTKEMDIDRKQNQKNNIHISLNIKQI